MYKSNNSKCCALILRRKEIDSEENRKKCDKIKLDGINICKVHEYKKDLSTEEFKKITICKKCDKYHYKSKEKRSRNNNTKLKKLNEQRKRCKGINFNGTSCDHYVLDDEDYCKLHQKNQSNNKETKKTKLFDVIKNDKEKEFQKSHESSDYENS